MSGNPKDPASPVGAAGNSAQDYRGAGAGTRVPDAVCTRLVRLRMDGGACCRGDARWSHPCCPVFCFGKGPGGWTQFLDRQRAHTAERQSRTADLLQSIGRRAGELDVAAVALKGSALHAMGIYACGDRPMADIDLLVRPADEQRMVEVFEELGFREQKKSWKERCFVPPSRGVRRSWGRMAQTISNSSSMWKICERLPWRITDVSELIFPLFPKAGIEQLSLKGGIDDSSPAACGGSDGVSVAAASASSRYRSTVVVDDRDDWNEFLESGTDIRRSWWAFPPLNLCSRYYSRAIPEPVLSSMAEICPSLLARACRAENTVRRFLFVPVGGCVSGEGVGAVDSRAIRLCPQPPAARRGIRRGARAHRGDGSLGAEQPLESSFAWPAHSALDGLRGRPAPWPCTPSVRRLLRAQ